MPELYSFDGRVLDVVPKGFDVRNDPGYNHEYFRLFETYNTGKRGVLVKYEGGSNPVEFYDMDGM